MSRIVAARKDIKILLVGNVLDKRYHKYVNDKIRQLNLGEYIKHIDYMEQSKLGDFLYNIPNAFILSSIHEVGVPLVAMEAIINDLPVIMPDFGVSSSFPIAENITTIPLLCDDIIDMDSGKVNKLSRKIHAPNENGLVAAMVYVADNTKVNHPKVKLRYDVLSIDTMVEKHIKLLELGDAKSER
jgi:glycosyltransferase involved in cell wall biosynthesis